MPTWERIADVVTEKPARVPGIERTNTLTSFRVYSSRDVEAAHDVFE